MQHRPKRCVARCDRLSMTVFVRSRAHTQTKFMHGSDKDAATAHMLRNPRPAATKSKLWVLLPLWMPHVLHVTVDEDGNQAEWLSSVQRTHASRDRNTTHACGSWLSSRGVSECQQGEHSPQLDRFSVLVVGSICVVRVCDLVCELNANVVEHVWQCVPRQAHCVRVRATAGALRESARLYVCVKGEGFRWWDWQSSAHPSHQSSCPWTPCCSFRHNSMSFAINIHDQRGND
jgi:hypothetical protein